MRRKITVTCKNEKIEVEDPREVYIWENWIEIKPKEKDSVDIEIKRGMEITIKCT